MIECIFTIDYEIYGNGEGSLRKLVYEPARILKEIFFRRNGRFVVFVEVAEMEMIQAKNTDSAIDLVKDQIRDFYNEGFELGLHLHPQWYNAQYENGKWLLDYSEYNLCTLSQERMSRIINRSVSYLRDVLGASDFTPLSFRAGNWLFQPTHTLAAVLAAQGIRVDSSVFKGGLQQQHRLDYRQALKNGYFWRFQDEVNVLDPKGALLELPIYTQMVPTWKVLTTKRIGLQQKGPPASLNSQNGFYRVMDFLRLRYPLKLDFCRMTMGELTHTVDKVIQEEQQNPEPFKPIVAIGHTKDLVDLKTVASFLTYLTEKSIPVSTFVDVYQKCIQ